MMRYILTVLLVLHFGLGLVSCTSPELDDEYSDSNDPISDEDVADAPDGDNLAESDDAELESEDGLEAAETGEEDVAKSENDVEDDAAFDDELESEPEQQQAQNEPAPVDELQPAEPEQELAPEPTPEPTTEPPPPVVIEEKTKVRDIRFMANSSGGTVVIETDKPVNYQSRLNPATQQFVIEMADVELPAALQRPFPTKGAGSRIGSINAYQGAGDSTARVVIQLSGPAAGEPIVQQEGTSLVVIPPTPAVASPIAKAEPPPAPSPGASSEEGGKAGALQARTLDEFLTGNQKFYGRLISLQVKDADVRDVVNFLAEESGANVVMSDDVDGKISLKLRRVPWDQALVTLMRTKGLGYVRQGNVLRISTLKSLQAETEAASKIIEAQKAIVPAVVEVIPVSYAAIDELQKNLTPFLSKEGKVVADNRTSTIIVTDKQEVVDRVRKLIKTLDIPPAQVSIESKIVEAVENFQNFIGINWSFGGSPVNLSPAGGANGVPIDLTMGVSSATISRNVAGATPFSASVNVGVLDFFGDIAAALTLAEAEELAKVISAPRISAMNREKSTITQEGENVAIKSTTVASSSNATSALISKEEKRTPYKLELSVTPQITADGGVIMDLDVKREFLGPEVDLDTKARAVNKRSAKTKVLVKNGQTAVIGGIYTSDELEFTNGVPGLRNIPIIGWLFKNRSYERRKNELLIFLTPRILAQDDLTQESNQATN